MNTPKITSVETATQEQASSWKQISDIIFTGGYRIGYDEGYEAGVDKYTLRRRFLFKSFEFILGIVVGVLTGVFVL